MPNVLSACASAARQHKSLWEEVLRGMLALQGALRSVLCLNLCSLICIALNFGMLTNPFQDCPNSYVVATIAALSVEGYLVHTFPAMELVPEHHTGMIKPI